MLSLMASILGLTFAAAPASAQGMTTLAAPEIDDHKLIPGSTFTIDITVQYVDGMFGYQFFLSWDPTILTATSISTKDPFIYPWGNLTEYGYLYMVNSYRPPEYFGLPGDFTMTPFTIAQVTFTVLAEGISKLDLYNTMITNVDGDVLTHEVVDGAFVNTPSSWRRWVDIGIKTSKSEHPDWFLSTDPDNTLTCVLVNNGGLATKAKVRFALTDGVLTVKFDSPEALIQPGKTASLSVTLTSSDMFSGFGSYTWTARVWYDSDGDGIIDAPGMLSPTRHINFYP